MATMKTHMPFFRENDYGIDRLLCAASAKSRKWKLHAQIDGKLHQVPTGFPVDVVECAPTFWQDNEGLHISLIAGMGKKREHIPYRMYLLHAANQTELLSGPLVEDTGFSGFTGFINGVQRGYLRAFSDRTEIVVENDLEVHELVAHGCYIYRLSYCPDDPAMILVSGSSIDGTGEFSVAYHLETGDQQELITDGVPAYKAAMSKGEVQYALRYGNDFEDREVCVAKSCEFRPCSVLTSL